MDTFVNPLRNSMRNVSNAVKSLPDSLAEGVTKMSDNVGRMSERLGQDIKQSFFKVSSFPVLWKAHCCLITYSVCCFPRLPDMDPRREELKGHHKLTLNSLISLS